MDSSSNHNQMNSEEMIKQKINELFNPPEPDPKFRESDAYINMKTAINLLIDNQILTKDLNNGVIPDNILNFIKQYTIENPPESENSKESENVTIMENNPFQTPIRKKKPKEYYKNNVEMKNKTTFTAIENLTIKNYFLDKYITPNFKSANKINPLDDTKLMDYNN